VEDNNQIILRMNHTVKLAYILSLPRSGSTVLSAMLDRQKGIVSPPESSFPQILSVITAKERADKKWLSALYIGSTFVPTPLSLEDAEACMEGSDEEILISLGLAIAAKLNRDPALIRLIVWKTPRTVGMHKVPLSTSGKFVILRRNPHNVFESQFRVAFGENNRNPYRFAIFRESYEHAFARLPCDRVFELEYDSLPEILPALQSFLGVESAGEWEHYEASLDRASKECSHMTTVTAAFENKDPQKRANLKAAHIASLEFAMKLARLLRPCLGPVRAFYDQQSMVPIRERARTALATSSIK
jgi:hypothetical protein